MGSLGVSDPPGTCQTPASWPYRSPPEEGCLRVCPSICVFSSVHTWLDFSVVWPKPRTSQNRRVTPRDRQ